MDESLRLKFLTLQANLNEKEIEINELAGEIHYMEQHNEYTQDLLTEMKTENENLLNEKYIEIDKIQMLERTLKDNSEEIMNIRAEKKELNNRILILQQERDDDKERVINLDKNFAKETLLRNSAFQKCQDLESFLRLERDRLSVYQVTFYLKIERECRFEKRK